ncbi:uncharacterized protein BKCO1_5200080 [Diplodia corticola]|uniref:Uncharacterized protein n=1 Tax=Diplodia corticola TaxID=236234 RepID=A0A1J9QQB0_9PEZI|nr:uncharacterized protein BKCO1_5200080 [Diplodia corticola]OJD31110.1 hypothetical protein BKCO1_5200080 [Diplodia corticola]
MANLLRNKAVWAVGGALGVFYMVPKFSGNSDNVFETPGVQNIGERWSAGGGTPTHTPATATRRGDPHDTESPRDGPTSVNTEHFKEKLADQRVARVDGQGLEYCTLW